MPDFEALVANELDGLGRPPREVAASPEAVALSALLHASVSDRLVAEAMQRATSIDEVLDLIAVDRIVAAGLASTSSVQLDGRAPDEMLRHVVETARDRPRRLR